jgi:hypothetical protein
MAYIAQRPEEMEEDLFWQPKSRTDCSDREGEGDGQNMWRAWLERKV